MRLLLFLLAFIPFALPSALRSAELKAGSWEFTETADGERTSWYYDLFPSAGMIVGVGHPVPDLTNFSLDEALDFTACFVFLNKEDDGSYRGLFLEADGKGKQISFGIEGEVSDDGKTLTFTGRNQLGDEISRASGRLLHESPKAEFHPGKWMVREVVTKHKGGWDIYWDFTFAKNAEGISGSGNKMSVNEKEATPGEKKTTSKITLNLPDEKGRFTGTGVETNAAGKKIQSEYQGWMAPSGNWFVLQSYENDRATSVIHGTWDKE